MTSTLRRRRLWIARSLAHRLTRLDSIVAATLSESYIKLDDMIIRPICGEANAGKHIFVSQYGRFDIEMSGTTVFDDIVGALGSVFATGWRRTKADRQTWPSPSLPAGKSHQIHLGGNEKALPMRFDQAQVMCPSQVKAERTLTRTRHAFLRWLYLRAILALSCFVHEFALWHPRRSMPSQEPLQACISPFHI